MTYFQHVDVVSRAGQAGAITPLARVISLLDWEIEMTAEASNKLCATSRHGYWTIDGPHDGAFVVLDHDGERLAFLLKAWRGRPAFTMMPLDGVELAAEFHDEVITVVDMYSHFAPSYSYLGVMWLKEDQALTSTIDCSGQPVQVQLGELASVMRIEGCYWFRWGLMLKSTRMKTEEIVFWANGNDCWLNTWRAPFWEGPDGYEDDGNGGMMFVGGPDMLGVAADVSND